MNKAIFLVAAGLCSATFLSAPAVAQPQFEFGIDQNGRPRVGIGDADQERYSRREYWRQRREEDRARAYEEGRREAWRDRRYRRYDDDEFVERCRTVIVREENEWGRLATRRIRRCG